MKFQFSRHSLEESSAGAKSKFMPAALVLLAETTTADIHDRVAMDVVIMGQPVTGWSLSADERGEMYDKSRPAEMSGPPQMIPFTAENGTFHFALRQLETYRRAAHTHDDCVLRPDDALAFRFTWREHGETLRVTYADSCGGIPDDVIEQVRPIGQRIDKALPLIVAVPDK